MTPSQLSERLRRIASAIDNSKNPDRALVAAELQKVVASMTRKAGWDEAMTVFQKAAPMVEKLDQALKAKSDEAANLAGALSGHLKDVEDLIGG